MGKVTCDKQLTALLMIDPYNDFISEVSKILDRLKGVAEANKCVPHMMQREQKLKVRSSIRVQARRQSFISQQFS